MEVPSKIKKFLWKVCSVAVPCCFELWRRKIKDSPQCPICLKEHKTIEHFIFFVIGQGEFGSLLVQV